ncbi:hypothetical protein SAMN05444920_102804 [Nonomuraea solani]|uniref:Uncharacterized protein n=1 Tax=Nonomuraea solani TaxID=1144553 RepID=A0A1H5ZRK6_9ACTN|nr:hypothetical protein SAMN05444920_102804 [Nonomuraea solani]
MEGIRPLMGTGERTLSVSEGCRVSAGLLTRKVPAHWDRSPLGALPGSVG